MGLLKRLQCKSVVNFSVDKPVSEFQSDASRWQAVTSRDSNADGIFVYAVLTTGIVCYPSCPSRAALSDNVRYFDTVQEALGAGFRYCKRCRTDQPPLAIRNRELVIQACKKIDSDEEPVRIEMLAQSLGVSRYHLQKLFKHHLGISPKAYAQAIRAERLQAQCGDDKSVTRTLLDAGYDSASSFYADVNKRLGMSAGTLRKGASGVDIHYQYAQTNFGLIAVAQTSIGVCAVLFGDSRSSLLDELKSRFPNASLHAGPAGTDQLLSRVIDAIHMPDSSTDIPLDIQGTAFQERIWQALRDIAPGQTASYAKIAKAIDKPGSARAVAGACAANPLAVLIPCHRVVKSDGSLSGYRWGVERKRALLDNEASLDEN